MKSFNQLQEVLKKSDDMSKWISDFVNSDNPKFAGKSKKERIKMAQGAYYGAQKENISIDEADKMQGDDPCWKGYEMIGTKKKGGKEVPNCVPVKEGTKEDLPFEPDAPKKNPSAKAGKHGLGPSVARHLARQGMKKVAKEEVELEEAAHVYDTKTGKVHSTHDTYKKAINAMNKLNKEHPGYDTPGGLVRDKFGAKLAKEEVEQIDEISKDTLRSYADKAFQHGNDLHYDIAHERDKDEKAKMKAKLSKRNDGVIKAAKKLREGTAMLSFDDYLKEAKACECKKEELHPNQKKLDMNKNGKLDKDDFKKLRKEETLDEVTSPMQKLRDAHDRHMQKALAANKAGDDTATKVHQQYMQKITAKMNKLKQNEEIDLVEMEELCEISKATLGSYVKKSHDQLVKHSAAKAAKYTRGDKDSLNFELSTARKEGNRQKGIDTAVKKLTKEETEPMLTFKELMENISEGKIDDLKDRIAARKATQSAYDKDYKPAAKTNVQKVKGHSYGAGEEEGEDDDDNTKKLSKPAKPEVKRGRGRPAGSKSGARN